MLMVLFHLGNSRYAIPVRDVVEVTPRVELEVIARTPDYVAGLFNYRGRHVPVIDLCRALQHRACADSYTSRIILVTFPLTNGGSRVLGLLAERVTETLSVDADGFAETGLNMSAAPYLGRAAHTEQGLLQQVNVADLLPENVKTQLFPAEAG
jgi:chemotaxis-related protein WspB